MGLAYGDRQRLAESSYRRQFQDTSNRVGTLPVEAATDLLGSGTGVFDADEQPV